MGEDKRKGRLYRSATARISLIVVASGGAIALGTLPTTLTDFFHAGSQPGILVEPMHSVQECMVCHGNFNISTEPFRPWTASMMGQAARDPLLYAALAIANKDAAFSGDLCLRCHAPMGWIDGRSTPTDGDVVGDDRAWVSPFLVGAALGVTGHLCRDLVGTTSVSLFWPFTNHAFGYPHRVYLGGLLVLSAVPFTLKLLRGAAGRGGRGRGVSAGLTKGLG